MEIVKVGVHAIEATHQGTIVAILEHVSMGLFGQLRRWRSTYQTSAEISDTKDGIEAEHAKCPRRRSLLINIVGKLHCNADIVTVSLLVVIDHLPTTVRQTHDVCTNAALMN